jgi:hypothetical protein
MAKSTTIGYVYWLFDGRCFCPWRHGYIGVTVNWPHRLHRHRTESDFPSTEFEAQVLFRGGIQECLALEQQMRPSPDIGWNRNPGGLSGHAMKGIPKSPEQKAKMRAAALARYADPRERKRTSEAVKLSLNRIDRSGNNNSMFGKHMSEEAKAKVRARIAERGGLLGKNNPNYRRGDYCE